MVITDIIRETPIIREAIERNDIPSLYDAVKALLYTRGELQRLLLTNPTQEVQYELSMLEILIGNVVTYLSDFHGIDDIAGKLYLQGAISTRGDILRLAAPIYDRLDTHETEKTQVVLLGIVGQIASGKGTVGEIIAEKYNGMHLPLSDRLREVAVAKGNFPPQTRDDLRKVHEAYKPRFGNPVFVRWTISIAKRFAPLYKKPVISLDGFRSLEEAKLFQSEGGILIAVTASPETRYQRVISRGRAADDFSRNAFDKSDAIEQQWINPIIEIADVTINNDGNNLEEFERAIEEVIQQFIPNSNI